MRTLIAIPVYNEEKYVERVLSLVRAFATDILVIDDGSTDATPCLLARQGVAVIRHARNRGYGRSMQHAFRWGCVDHYDWVITMDCDEQHEPAAIPSFMKRIEADEADVISGTRYLTPHPLDDRPPLDRRAINQAMTQEINSRLGLHLTDAFCGFKAYRVSAISRLDLDIDGYDFPMQFWVQAVAHDLRIVEQPIRLIYNDPNRTFGGPLSDPRDRMAHYRDTLHRELLRCAGLLPASAVIGLEAAPRNGRAGRDAACCCSAHRSGCDPAAEEPAA